MPLRNHAASDSSEERTGRELGRRVGRIVWKVVVVASLLFNFYLIGLVRHSPGSYSQLKAGGTAAFPGTVTKISTSHITVKTSKGTERIALSETTPFALFPKDYQTLIAVGLPASAADVVAKATEASVSAQLPYMKIPQALRVNLVRSDVLTGKVIEISANTLKFKGFAASGAKEEVRSFASGATVVKLGGDGSLTPATLADVQADMGLYAFLDKPASDASGQITRLIVADFSTPAIE